MNILVIDFRISGGMMSGDPDWARKKVIGCIWMTCIIHVLCLVFSESQVPVSGGI